MPHRHDVIDAVRARDLRRAIGAAVVDDQPLDDVDAGHLARQLGKRDRERLGLVEARDLDDELLHASLLRRGRSGWKSASSDARSAGPYSSLANASWMLASSHESTLPVS